MDMHLLPPELVILIARYASPYALVKMECLSRAFLQLLRDADSQCWQHYALEQIPMVGTSRLSLSTFVNNMKNRFVAKDYWDDVRSWKDAYRRLVLLDANWSISTTPETRTDLVGFLRVDPHRSALPVPKLRSLTSSRPLDVPYAASDSSYVWRARLDTAKDANFIITTWHTGGLKVVDAGGTGSVLWELPRWSVRPYAHLEYQEGVAVWDSENGIEVWKRWKLILGESEQDEPPNKRGTFVKVATLPEVANTRGFMLNEDLHLTICSSDGRSYTYDLTDREPRLISSYDIPNGAAGHLEHDSDIAVYSMGQKGYSIYHKQSASFLGEINFAEDTAVSRVMDESKETNFFKVDSRNRYSQLAANDDNEQEELDSQHRIRLRPPRKQFVTVTLEQGGLAERQTNQEVIELEPFIRGTMGLPDTTLDLERTNAIPLHQDLWGAAMVRKLGDGATLLVARSRGGRLLVCSDLLGLLSILRDGTEEAASFKIRECVSVVECGGRASRTEFYTGGWLAVHNGRAAWEIDDQVYMMDLPCRRNTLLAKTPIWMLPSLYDDEIPMPSMQIPISFMSLHSDVFMSTFLHPAYILVTDRGFSRWETTILKSVRIVHFAPRQIQDGSPSLKGKKQRKEEEEDNTVPLTNENKNLHRHWAALNRRLAAAAEVQAEESEEWTDEEDSWE